MELIVSLSDAKIFQNEKLILNNVNLQIYSGELIFLTGKVGSGKTSLIKTLYADLPLKHGNGKVADFPLKNISQKQIPLLRRKLGIVFQDFQLLNDRNIFENLIFVLQATGWKKQIEMKNRIYQVLTQVQLLDKQHQMSYELSGGEQQRAAIARALLNFPKVILADEPTGNLDPESSERIVQILTEVAQTGSAVLIATHNYSLIKKEAKILRCENGYLLS